MKKLKPHKKIIKSYSGFKVGDNIIILKKPSCWNSICNGNCPIEGRPKIVYPYKMKIIKMMQGGVNNKVGITEGEYGWSLNCLIEENKIKFDIKESRKSKLLNLRW